MARKPKRNTLNNGEDTDGVDAIDIRKQAFQNMDLDESGDEEEDFNVKADEEEEGDQPEGDQPGAEEDDPFGLNALEQEQTDAEQRSFDQPVRKKGQEQEQRQEQRQPQQRPARYQVDKNGNVIDPKTGTVLAKAGNEAKLFQARVRADLSAYRSGLETTQFRQGLQRAVDIARELQAENKQLKATIKVGTDLGLSPQEQAEALQIASKFRTAQGAAEGLKTILTRLAANGIDVTQQLGLPGGGIDMKGILDAVNQKIDEATKPIREDNERRQQTAEQRQRQEQQYRQVAQGVIRFFEQNPAAVPYANVIEQALRDPRFEDWTPREVWQQIQLHMARSPRTPSRSNGQRQSSIPSGRRVPAGGESFDVRKSAPTGTSYEDIVNELLDRSGA